MGPEAVNLTLGCDDNELTQLPEEQGLDKETGVPSEYYYCVHVPVSFGIVQLFLDGVTQCICMYM